MESGTLHAFMSPQYLTSPLTLRNLHNPLEGCLNLVFFTWYFTPFHCIFSITRLFPKKLSQLYRKRVAFCLTVSLIPFLWLLSKMPYLPSYSRLLENPFRGISWRAHYVFLLVEFWSYTRQNPLQSMMILFGFSYLSSLRYSLLEFVSGRDFVLPEVSLQ